MTIALSKLLQTPILTQAVFERSVRFYLSAKLTFDPNLRNQRQFFLLCVVIQECLEHLADGRFHLCAAALLEFFYFLIIALYAVCCHRGWHRSYKIFEENKPYCYITILKM
jgi:hypothetical protein